MELRPSRKVQILLATVLMVTSAVTAGELAAQPTTAVPEAHARQTARKADGEPRLAVPGEAAQAAARQTIKEVFGKQWEAARTSAARQALAASLLEQADKLADDPAGQFVLLEMARDMAVRGDDPKTALAAADALDATFEVDGLAVKADTVVRLTGSVTGAEQAKMLLEQTLNLVDAAVSREAFAQARELVTAAAKIAYKARDKALRERIEGYRQWTDELVREHPRYLEAMKKLDADPADPEANLTAGRFLWFGKGDSVWGIPMLALGSDAGLKTLAIAELKVTDSIDERVTLADGWWERAAHETGRAQQQVRWRAAGWYQLVLPKLSGLAKARVEKRLSEVSGPIPPLRSVAVRPRGAPDFGDKKVLLIFGYPAEMDTAKAACDKYNLAYDTASSYDRNKEDYSVYHTIISGSNNMNYWKDEEGKKPESFGHLEAWINSGGHLVVLGSWNGVNNHHLERYGIKTSYFHTSYFEPVPGVTEKLFAGNEDLVPADCRLQSVGNFKVSVPHTVLLKRGGKAYPGESKLVTLVHQKGRVTFTLVEPAYKKDYWIITVLLSWIARGCPT